MKRPLLVSTAMLCLFFFECKKESIVTVNVPVVHSWLLDSFVTNSNKILTASLPLNDSIIAVANRFSIWYINAKRPNTPINGIYVPGSSVYSITFPPSLTKNLSVSVRDPNHLSIYTTYNPVSPFGITDFYPAYHGSSLSIKGLSFAYNFTGGYPIINAKYILAPTEIDFTTMKAYFSLLKVDTTPVLPGIRSVSLVSSSDLILDPGPSTVGFSDGSYFSASYFGKFFVSYYNQFYRIDTLGNIKAFGYSPVSGLSGGINNMFTVNNYLFALGFGKFFVSQDQGETWNLFLDATGSIYGSLTYTNVGNDLYSTTGSQIAKVTLNGNSFTFKELANDGLETSQITSINKCGKYVYATTLSGLYYKDTTSFNTFK